MGFCVWFVGEDAGEELAQQGVGGVGEGHGEVTGRHTSGALALTLDSGEQEEKGCGQQEVEGGAHEVREADGRRRREERMWALRGVWRRWLKCGGGQELCG